MDNQPYSVKIHCPISSADEYVFFYPVEHKGEWYVSFNGCDSNWHACKECETCYQKAYEILTNTPE